MNACPTRTFPKTISVPTRKSSDQLSLFIASAESTEPVIHAHSSSSTMQPEKRLWADNNSATGSVGAANAVATTAASPCSPADTHTHESEEPEECEWSSFIRRHGRVPTIDDDKKPWEYRGWLLYYRMLLEDHPAVGRRWDYWCRTMIWGHVLPEPVPRLGIAAEPDRIIFKAIEDWVRLIDRDGNGGSAVDKLLDWLLFGFGHSMRPPDLSEELNGRLYRQVNIGPMLVAPYDYLGEWVGLQKSGWNPNAFYPTPHSVVECMVRMTLDREEDARGKTIMDPCVGSGRMLIHASNYSLRLYGIDIDPMMVKLTCVNGALYVPWILRPFPARFFSHQNRVPTLEPAGGEPTLQPHS
jgi:hypothetical protein